MFAVTFALLDAVKLDILLEIDDALEIFELNCDCKDAILSVFFPLDETKEDLNAFNDEPLDDVDALAFTPLFWAAEF